MSKRRGLLLIISSPSGAGKTTLSRRLQAWDASIRFSVSVTTRPARDGEVDGREYHFHSRAEIEAMVQNGELLEHAEVFGHLYGSPLAPVLAAMRDGCDTLFDIDWQGGAQIATSALKDEVVSIFILPPSMAELERRLRARGQDDDAVIAGRLTKSRAEISHWREYDYVLVNHDMDTVEATCRAIVTAERARRIRQSGLEDFVGGLDDEFSARA